VTTAGIVLAAHALPDGRSPALLAWLDDATLIEWQIVQLRLAGIRDIEVVVGCEPERVIPLISGDNVEAIVDGRWASGLGSSLRVGASAVPRGTDVAVITRVDAPRPAVTFVALLDAFEQRSAPVVRAAYGAVAGLPLIIGEDALAAARNAPDGDDALDRVLARFPVTASDVGPLAALCVEDTPSIERALAMLAD
jgi:nicotine blue oxidoreductase